MLAWLKSENINVYNYHVEWLFRKGFRLDDEAVSQILDGKAQGRRHRLIWPQPF